MSEENKIKAGKAGGASPIKAPKVETGENKIEVSESVLKDLIASNKDYQARIDKLESNAVATNGGISAFNNPMMMKKNKETFIRMKKWDDKYCIGYENVGKPNKPIYVYNEYNPQTREMVQFCNVIIEGEEKPLKLEYIVFLREAESVLVKMKQKIELEDKITNQGMVYKKDFAENGYGMFETMMQVPVDIIEKQYKYVVELEDGRALEIDEQVIIG